MSETDTPDPPGMAKHGKGGGGGKGADAAGGKKGASGSGPAAANGAGASSSGIITGGSGVGAYSLEIREGCVALMRFRTRDGMNALLDPISNAMEGVIANRLGHNFALSDKDREHQNLRKTCGLPKTVRGWRAVWQLPRGVAQLTVWRS